MQIVIHAHLDMKQTINDAVSHDIDTFRNRRCYRDIRRFKSAERTFVRNFSMDTIYTKSTAPCSTVIIKSKCYRLIRCICKVNAIYKSLSFSFVRNDLIN